jgi:O-antigen chain-terminating methyltransferase
VSRPTLEDLVARLERERQDADRAYNDALTALDRAYRQAPGRPRSPEPIDPAPLHAVNQAWNILPEGAPGLERSPKGKLRGFIWRLVGPSIETQRQFNAAVVDHLNRSAEARAASDQALAAVCDTLRDEFEALALFNARLVEYVQLITPYVDTKDRGWGGPHLRDAVVLAQERTLALKREVERLLTGAATAPEGRSVSPAEASSSEAFKYVGFEDRFRGSREAVRARLADYVPLLSGASDVVDLGCGRGELLELLREHGIGARGVDANPEMVQICRDRGFQVEAADALSYLGAQADHSLGGIVAIQVVEHFEPGYLARLLETAFHKLRPQAPLVLETINPACWMAFFETYVRDLTHARPLHPDTLRFLVQASGFTTVDLQFRSPVRDTDRLTRVDERAASEGALAHAINQHADALNARLFSFMDYAVIARR